jgi:hypothetical protein
LYVIPGAVLKKGASDLGEVDLLGYMAEHLILGEVKTSPADFNEDQVKKDLSLAAQISADIYVMVTVRPLTERQKGMAAGLAAAQGCRLLTFSVDAARPATSS